MKIYVYAICKNEIDNIFAWIDSMKEADEIFVLDTGSTDGSFEKLKELNVNVKQEIITPFRFDIARNKSLEMVKKDGDLYVCTDLDERFEKGWRNKIEKSYTKKYTRIKYTYNWSLDSKNNPKTSFLLDKIHTKGYYWLHPVHEVLTTNQQENILSIESIVLNHYPKYKKERKNYLRLLELSIKESPLDDRNMHYLGREYMYNKKYKKAISTLHKHLNLKSALWADERSASYRYIARCYKEIHYLEESSLFYTLAIIEAPYLRENYVEYAYLEYNKENYQHAISLLDEAIKIKNKSNTYINEEFAWDYHIYDLYSLCYYYINEKEKAKEYLLIALKINPDNKRLQNNLFFFD